MDSERQRGGAHIDWEDVLEFLRDKQRLATKFEASFGRRKQELDVGLAVYNIGDREGEKARRFRRSDAFPIPAANF